MSADPTHEWILASQALTEVVHRFRAFRLPEEKLDALFGPLWAELLRLEPLPEPPDPRAVYMSPAEQQEQLLHLIQMGKVSIPELAAVTERDRTVISRQLKVLEQLGRVQSSPLGRTKIWSLSSS